MADFGSRLREARERRGVSLREISDRTKISTAALEALERGDASRLPGGIFARSFVRSYAAEVGLDPDTTLREFLDLFGDDARFAVMSAAPAVLNAAATSRLGGRPLKILAASLVVVGIILYLVVSGPDPVRQRPDDRVAARRQPAHEPAAGHVAAAKTVVTAVSS